MIDLFNINRYKIDTAAFKNVLHDSIVQEFEEEFAEYVGAKHACGINSASNAIFLTFSEFISPSPVGHIPNTVRVPSIIPPVVPNSLIKAGINIEFTDNIDWVGHPYVLWSTKNWKIIDSAQKVTRDQFRDEADSNDIMIFSFYPTKPVGGIDGGMIVSNNVDKINWYKEAVFYGMSDDHNNWDRKTRSIGWKMYLNSIQAFVAKNNLMLLDHKNERLAEINEYYNNKLGYSNSSKHLYRVKVKNNKNFVQDMKNAGVYCGIHYKALHDHPLYSQYASGAYPSAEDTHAHTASIPFHEKLKNDQLKFICNAVKDHLVE
jgi:dTDP-4-amino-4,6-dideoxygalactose transaminase